MFLLESGQRISGKEGTTKPACSEFNLNSKILRILIQLERWVTCSREICSCLLINSGINLEFLRNIS